MPQQSIDMIKKAEQQAAGIRTAALDAAKASLQKAEEELAVWKDEQLKNIRQEAKNMLRAAEEDAQAKADEADARYEAERNAFRRQVLANMEQAVAMIVERIVNH